MQVDEENILITDIIDALKLLSKNHTIRIDDLDKHPDLKLAFNQIKAAVLRFHGNPAYGVIKQNIAMLIRPPNIQPETLGSYIWGCVQQCYGDAEKYCTPLCINSIPSETDEIPTCQSHVITREFEDGVLRITCLNCNRAGRSDITTAIIYSNEDIDSLTSHDVFQLQKWGITQVSIMVKDGYKYRKIMDMTPINNILVKEHISTTAKSYNEEHHHHRKPSGRKYSVWWILLLLVIVVILLLYFLR